MAYDRSVIKPMLDEISELVSSLLPFSIVFARHEANHAVHCCAKYASVHMESFFWDVEPPAFLEHNIGGDCNIVLMI